MVDLSVLRLFLILSLFSATLKADTLGDVIDALDMQRLAATYTELQVDRLLNGAGRELPEGDRRAAAVLATLGVLSPTDLAHPPSLQEKIKPYLEVLPRNHPALIGRVGDAGLPLALERDWQHYALEHDGLVGILEPRLSSGVVTGYDVRRRGIYDGFARGTVFIYSHSSRLHLKQLILLLAAEELPAWVYVTPKLGAFLYREEWGGQPEAIKTLSSGVRVIKSHEFAVLFQFDSPSDRIRFHQIILKHAKRDSAGETDLIADSWWQPFYYTDAPLEGFKPISLLILQYGDLEATLTVPEARTSAVISAFGEAAANLRRQRVWVNPAFYRFLHGDFK